MSDNSFLDANSNVLAGAQFQLSLRQINLTTYVINQE